MVSSPLFAGCDDPEIEDTRLRPYNCPTWQCGFNAADLNGRSIRELNLDGEPNSDGVRIVGFVAPLGLLGGYKLDTDGDALIARNAQGKTLKGAQLFGAIIFVRKDGPLELPIPLTVLGYQEVDAWADGAAKVPTYTIVYPDVGALLGVRNVCSGDLVDALASAVTVISDETYDLTQKTVNPGQRRWLTLACAGSAAAKMRLMNYSPHTDFDGQGHASSVAQRQATLKMITADYCGTGHSYTANGTPLQWENQDGTVASPGPYGAVEAIWTASGAACLDATRLPDVEVPCALPSCSEYDGPAGEWSTFVPD
ncbi:ADYC domain-containing protein [Nannocystis bainbridge]|uniref:ADYC domain-containing protein n=1 Tax=Nannocystis bainbridge TaxID=2995303 RepID=A0ABT5E8X4_9BACT|nr:ADYC domain-containing protein [Nannocystis bainbridge]MDC0722085.1 ADYC domain-containing protein [Nannocystis bainbridge]